MCFIYFLFFCSHVYGSRHTQEQKNKLSAYGLGQAWSPSLRLQTFIAMGDVSAGIKHAVNCHHRDGMRQKPRGAHGTHSTERERRRTRRRRRRRRGKMRVHFYSTEHCVAAPVFFRRNNTKLSAPCSWHQLTFSITSYFIHKIVILNDRWSTTKCKIGHGKDLFTQLRMPQ